MAGGVRPVACNPCCVLVASDSEVDWLVINQKNTIFFTIVYLDVFKVQVPDVLGPTVLWLLLDSGQDV
jgi:hypothetical protein